MRIRFTTAGGAVVALTLATAGPAGAAEAEAEAGSGPEADVSHAAEECIRVLEAGGEPSDCQEAPNPIVPAVNEVLWAGASFLILLVLMSKFLVPAVTKTMQARSDRIREGLDEAERTKAEAQTVLDQYQRQLAEARNEANRVIEEARQTADNLRGDLMTRAEQEVGELRARARDDIEAGKQRALAELQASVANLSIDLAEKIVEKSLDRDTNRQLVESYIRQLETK